MRKLLLLAVICLTAIAIAGMTSLGSRLGERTSPAILAGDRVSPAIPAGDCVSPATVPAKTSGTPSTNMRCRLAEAMNLLDHVKPGSVCLIRGPYLLPHNSFPGTVILHGSPPTTLASCRGIIVDDFSTDQFPPSSVWLSSMLRQAPDGAELLVMLPGNGTIGQFLREALEARVVTSPYSPNDRPVHRVNGTCPGQGYQWFRGRAVSLTFVIMAYRTERLKGVRDIIRHYASVPFISHTILIWNGLREYDFSAVRVAAATSPHGMRLTIISETVNSLNNRFKPSLPVVTASTLMGDDDCYVAKTELECMWAHWIRKKPEVLMGIEARGIGKGNTYGSGPPTHFVLPRTWIMPSSVRLLYNSEEYAAVRRYVDTQEAHCDDIAINLLLSNRTQQPHVVIDTSLINLPDYDKGLTAQNNRQGLRTECMRWLLEYFGGKEPRQVEKARCDVTWQTHGY